MAKGIEVLTHTRVGTGRTAVHTFTLKDGALNADGTVRNAVIVTDVSKIHASIIDAIIDERIKAKHVDAAAISRKDGLSASPITKAENVETVSARLQTGSADAWNAKRTSAPEVDIGTWLQRAHMALFPDADEAKVQKAIVGWKPEARLAMAARPEYRDMISKLKSAEVADVDTDALLAELI